MFRTSTRRGITSRIFLAFTICSVLGVALTFVSTPSANATAAKLNSSDTCYDSYPASSLVYDSYNHVEGDINLVQDSCTGGIAAMFNSNNNTWKSVTVYVEYTNVNGYLQGGPYGWQANAPFWSPWYHGSSCYYAEVNLVDNRGVDNWVGTSSVCV